MIGRWDAFNRAQIGELITSLGRSSAGDAPAKPPYVVFDWDNTSVFLDIEEAALIYQLENLMFGATPAQLEIALRKNIPKTPFVKPLAFGRICAAGGACGSGHPQRP